MPPDAYQPDAAEALSLWDRYQVAGPGAASLESDITALSRFAINMEAWWFGPQPSIKGAFWYDDGKGWRTYPVPAREPNAPPSGIAAVSRIPTSMEVWWLGSLGSVEGAFWYDDGKGWRAYERAVAGPGSASSFSGIAAVSRIPQSMEIWWIGITGSVEGAFWYQTDGKWHTYSVTGLGRASTHGGIAAVSRFDKNMEIWWVGPRGSVEGAFWYDDGKNWRVYGKPVAPDGSAADSHCIDAVSRTTTSMDVLWISPSGAVRWAYWNDGAEWVFDPTPVAPDGSASTASGITVIKRGATSMEAYWIAPDGSVRGAEWHAGVGWLRHPDPVAGKYSASTTGGITGLARTKSTVEVWWIAPDGSVQLAVRDDVTGPHEFRLLRPPDMVDLRCTAVGCRLAGGAGVDPAVHHTVKHGETLWDIAQQYYGDGFLYHLIAAANNLADPDVIHPGDVLVIPPRPAAAAPPVTYVVQSGDTLWEIAQRFYGNPFKYRVIAEANHLADPSMIVPGQKLIIPGVSPPPAGSRLVAVEDNAHIIVRFGIQHIFEQSTPTMPEPAPDPPKVAKSRSANESRVVFELPKGTEIPYTVAGVLEALTKLGLRVPVLAIPRVKGGDTRPDSARDDPKAPAADQTAIEAPYRLVVSPNTKYGGFTHSAEAGAAPNDENRVELWHTRLGVRKVDAQGKFLGVDEKDSEFRTVRPIWTRDKELPVSADPDFAGSLTRDDRLNIHRQAADPKEKISGQDKLIEPEPLDVVRLYLSTLGAWIDWNGKWDSPQYDRTTPEAYRHHAPMGRDQYVRVETPIYLYPFGHRATLVKLTERKIKLANNPAANLFTRFFIIVRERTRDYTGIRVPKQGPVEEHLVLHEFPFKTISIDPMVTSDIDTVEEPVKAAFVPKVNKVPYLWKVTGVDHANKEVTMVTALVAVPRDGDAHLGAEGTWIDDVMKPTPHPIDVGGAEVAFAVSKTPGDTTARVQWIEFTGVAQPLTSTPALKRASIEIPALAALNRGGGPAPVVYRKDYVEHGFRDGDPAQLYLRLLGESKLDFAGGSDRGGGFVEPSISVKGLSRTLGAIGDDGESGGDDITKGTFDPGKFLGTALPKLFGLFDLIDILVKGVFADAPKLITEQGNFVRGVAVEHAGLVRALNDAKDVLAVNFTSAEAAPAKLSVQNLINQASAAADAMTHQPVEPLVDLLSEAQLDAGNPAGAVAEAIRGALEPVKSLLDSPDLPAQLRTDVERPYHALADALDIASDDDLLRAALRSAVEGAKVLYKWDAKIKGWPPTGDKIFKPLGNDPRLSITVELRTSKDGKPQSVVSAALPDFVLQLLPGVEQLMEMTFRRIAFRTVTGGKPEVDVQFDGIKFLGILGFVDKLRQVIPLDGLADPPFVDVTAESATAGFDLALPSVAIGVFTLENIALGADCRIPFVGEAVTVGFFFCTKEAPFRLTVLAIGGGGWVGIRLSPNGLVLLELGLEAGASLSIDLVVASGSVSVMIGVYLRLEDKKGQLTAYFRIRGEVEVLGIVSASITLELSLRYDFKTGKLIGRATLTVEIEILFFSASVEITCERQLAGSKGDPTLKDIMPPDQGGQELWNEYYSSFAIGA